MTEGQLPERLNAGCGNNIREGWVNADLPDFDAGTRPWPWPDESFTHIYMGCLLPHLPPPAAADQEDPLHVAVTEAYRVLRPEGLLEVTGPDPRDIQQALAAVHHYRLIGPTTFSGYLHGDGAAHEGGGPKYATGGPFRKMEVSWGQYGAYRHNKVGHDGRPLGASRILPNFMPMGTYKLGVLTHLWRRLRFTAMLRGEKIRIRLWK